MKNILNNLLFIRNLKNFYLVMNNDKFKLLNAFFGIGDFGVKMHQKYCSKRKNKLNIIK